MVNRTDIDDIAARRTWGVDVKTPEASHRRSGLLAGGRSGRPCRSRTARWNHADDERRLAFACGPPVSTGACRTKHRVVEKLEFLLSRALGRGGQCLEVRPPWVARCGA